LFAGVVTGQDKHREKQTIKKHPPSVKGTCLDHKPLAFQP